MSLSAVPDLRVEFKIRSATNTSCGGTTSLVALTEMVRPRSSVKVLMSINASSREVSLRSAIVTARLANVPPPESGCAVENSG